jgi:hypothetical protein
MLRLETGADSGAQSPDGSQVVFRIKVICAVWQEASARAARLVPWARTAKDVDDVLGMS